MGDDFTPKILIVDDIKENLVLLETFLRRLEAKTVRAQGALEALKLVEEEEFALLILDIQMPGMDGFELAQKARSGKKNATTPIIFLTAVYVDKVSEFKGYQSGGVDFIRKPYEASILLNKVSVFLELYRQRHELKKQNNQLKKALNAQRVLQNQLQTCAKNYEAIVEDQTEYIFRFDEQGNVAFVNQAFCDFLGMNRSLMVNRSLAEVVPVLYMQLYEKLSGSSPVPTVMMFEGSLQNGEGNHRWIEWSLRNDRSERGEYLVVGRDVTEKQKFKETLIKKEGMLRRAQQLAKLGSWEWDSQTDHLWISDEIYNIYGIPTSQELHSFDDLIRFIHPDDRKAASRIFSNLPQLNQKITLQHRVVHPTERVKYVRVEFSVEYDSTNDIKRISGASQDVTDYIVIESALKENLYQLFEPSNSLPQTFFELNGEGKVLFLNEMGQSFFGCNEDGLKKGVLLKEFFVTEDQEQMEKTLSHLKQDKDIVVGEFSAYDCRRNIRRVLLFAVTVNTGSKERRVKGILLDITNRVNEEKILQENSRNYMKVISRLKQAEEEISKDYLKLKKRVEEEVRNNELQRQLLIQKSKLESLGKLATSMVHEINQPLAGISMIMDNILLRLSMNKIDEKYLREKCMHVFDDIDRIKNFLQHVGLYSTAQKEEKNESVEVNEIVKNSLTLIKNQYKNWDVELKVEQHPTPLYVYGNRYKLEQVLVDLMINSYESLEEKVKSNGSAVKSSRWIKVSTQLDESEVKITIKDNGLGIDDDNLNYIFEPFFSTRDSGIGSGLSLYITKGIVQKMKGRIEVRSRKNDFTEVVVYFPVVEEVLDREEEVEEHRKNSVGK